MPTAKDRKQKLIKDYATKDSDTGSPEVQVAILTEKIQHLTQHLQTHKKDFTSRRGLLMMVGQQRRLLKSLQSTSVDRYQTLIKRLGLRK